MQLRHFFVFIQLSMGCLLAGNYKLHAQDINENNFTLYTKQQGLSNTSVTSLAQDSIGYIWIATASGLNRFNGSSFVQFHSANDSLSLPQENLTGLAKLDKYRLAAYTSEGLHIVNTRTGKTKNLFIPYSNKQYEYKFNGIMAACGNEAGDVFVLTRSGFYHFDNNCQLVFRYDNYNREELATAHFIFGKKLLWLSHEQLAIISSTGIYYYHTTKHVFNKMTEGDCPELKEFLDYPKTPYEFFQPKYGLVVAMNLTGDSMECIDTRTKKRTVAHLPFAANGLEFDNRSEMVAISDTLFAITGNVSGFYTMTHDPGSGEIKFCTKKYFPFYYCRNLLYDHDHYLWIATNKGLLRQNISQLRVMQAVIPSSLQDSFPNITVDDVYTNGDSLFAATRGNSGLLLFNKENLQFARRISFAKFPDAADNVFCLQPVNDNTLLAGTTGPLVSINLWNGNQNEIVLDKFDRSGAWISDLCRDYNNDIWVVAADNIYKYNVLSHESSLILDSKEIRDKIQDAVRIKEDMCGNIWISGHGLLRYNTLLHCVDRVVDSFPFIRRPDQLVNIFTPDQQGNLWINSNNNGLICYNINSPGFRHFTTDNGLPDNNISAMIVIRDKLWMAGSTGISCIDLKTFMISTFGTEDGFPDLPIAKGAKFFYDKGADKLYIGFTNAVVQFDPSLVFQRSQVPHLFIESLMTGDQKKFLFPGKEFSSTWQDKAVTITIGSINFFTSNSQRFAYRLLKDDSSTWQWLGSQNTFSISNLTPGRYRVQVMLYSLSNRWPSQMSEIYLSISPPFWQTKWFMILSAIFLILTVYFLLKWRTEFIQKKEQAKTHLQQLKAEEYKMQYELEQISNYFSSSLAGKKNVEDVLWDVASNLIGRMNYMDCMIYCWNEEKTRMVQKASFGPKGDRKSISSSLFDVLPGQGVVGEVIRTEEPLLIPDTRLDIRYRVDDIKRLSELCVPIIHNNELIGVIDSEHPEANHFKERDVKILTTIATLVGNKIKQLESEESLQIKKDEIVSINLKLAEAQLSALQTQMNPHFIFNSLNSIKRMILANEQMNASRYLSKFAQMIRITLNQSKETYTTLYENVEHLETYLAMEKLRFDDSFTFRVSVDGDIDKEEILIPTLMIQPIAENAIWHGLMPKKGARKLSVRFSRLEETIACSIEDNGIGIRHSEELKQTNGASHQSVGLNNLRNRIKILNEKFDSGCSLEITDLKDINKDKCGTRVILRFKMICIKPKL